MNRRHLLIGASLAAIWGASPLLAHGPSRQKVTETVLLDASPDEVWAVIGNFGDLSWFPLVTAVAVPDGAEVKSGLRRTVTWANGEQTVEVLTKWQPEKRSYSFRTVEDNIKALAVTNYSGVLTVNDQDGKALVEWVGAFYRGFPNNDPPPELDDEAALRTVTEAHRAGLDALAARFTGLAN